MKLIAIFYDKKGFFLDIKKKNFEQTVHKNTQPRTLTSTSGHQLIRMNNKRIDSDILCIYL